jgi:hypothetical protein
MNNLTLDNIKIEDLKNRINNLRDVLNEICCTDSSTEVEEEKLGISRQLDALIVEYMNKML